MKKPERLKITCEELPDIYVTDTTKEEVQKFYKAPPSLIKNVKKYDEHFLYHLNNHCFRAMRGDELLGFLILAPKHKKSKKGEVLYLDMIYVLKQHRRQHIGHFLFMVANALSRQMGYNALFFESDKNLPDSVPFCEAMVKHVKEDYNGNVVDRRD